MEKNSLHPWDNWAKYKLVARPSAADSASLEEIRSSFKSLHPHEGQYPLPELSFFNHRLPESSEAILQSWLFNLLSTQYGFQVVVNNISGIPPHYVFARIQSTPQHTAFEQKLVAMLSQLSGITASQIKHSQQCRLALITDLPGIVFHQAMQFFSGVDLCTTIEVQQFELLKMQQGGDWKLLQRYQLASSPNAAPTLPWFQPA